MLTTIRLIFCNICVGFGTALHLECKDKWFHSILDGSLILCSRNDITEKIGLYIQHILTLLIVRSTFFLLFIL